MGSGGKEKDHHAMVHRAERFEGGCKDLPRKGTLNRFHGWTAGRWGWETGGIKCQGEMPGEMTGIVEHLGMRGKLDGIYKSNPRRDS